MRRMADDERTGLQVTWVQHSRGWSVARFGPDRWLRARDCLVERIKGETGAVVVELGRNNSGREEGEAPQCFLGLEGTASQVEGAMRLIDEYTGRPGANDQTMLRLDGSKGDTGDGGGDGDGDGDGDGGGASGGASGGAGGGADGLGNGRGGSGGGGGSRVVGSGRGGGRGGDGKEGEEVAGRGEEEGERPDPDVLCSVDVLLQNVHLAYYSDSLAFDRDVRLAPLPQLPRRDVFASWQELDARTEAQLGAAETSQAAEAAAANAGAPDYYGDDKYGAWDDLAGKGLVGAGPVVEDVRSQSEWVWKNGGGDGGGNGGIDDSMLTERETERQRDTLAVQCQNSGMYEMGEGGLSAVSAHGVLSAASRPFSPSPSVESSGGPAADGTAGSSGGGGGGGGSGGGGSGRLPVANGNGERTSAVPRLSHQERRLRFIRKLIDAEFEAALAPGAPFGLVRLGRGGESARGGGAAAGTRGQLGARIEHQRQHPSLIAGLRVFRCFGGMGLAGAPIEEVGLCPPNMDVASFELPLDQQQGGWIRLFRYAAAQYPEWRSPFLAAGEPEATMSIFSKTCVLSCAAGESRVVVMAADAFVSEAAARHRVATVRRRLNYPRVRQLWIAHAYGSGGPGGGGGTSGGGGGPGGLSLAAPFALLSRDLVAAVIAFLCPDAEEMRVLAGDATGRYHSPTGRLGRKVGR